MRLFRLALTKFPNGKVQKPARSKGARRHTYFVRVSAIAYTAVFFKKLTLFQNRYLLITIYFPK